MWVYEAETSEANGDGINQILRGQVDSVLLRRSRLPIGDVVYPPHATTPSGKATCIHTIQGSPEISRRERYGVQIMSRVRVRPNGSRAAPSPNGNHMNTPLPFKKRTQVIAASIIAASLIAFILVSVFVSNIFATELFAGLTAIASLGILISAVAAAVYTKPAYDEFRKQLRPYQLHFEDFTLEDHRGQPLRTKVLTQLDATSTQRFLMAPETFAPPVFVISNTHGSIIKFQVIFDSDEVDRNIDVHFNLIAPACWEMNTTQDNHKIVRTSVPYKICDTEVEATFSLAERTLTPDVKLVFFAEMRFTGIDTPQRGTTWPMAFRLGLQRGEPIYQEWSIEIEDEATVSGSLEVDHSP